NKVLLLKFGAKEILSLTQMWRGPAAQAESMANNMKKMSVRERGFDLVKKGGAPRWGEPLLAPGKLSTNTTEPYVVDTLTVPETNPFNSWIRCSGIDFFSDGTRAAVCSVSGDVWLLSNIDDKLDRVTWKRYATGLFQPLGLKIVDDNVYVLGRDQIT